MIELTKNQKKVSRELIELGLQKVRNHYPLLPEFQ